MSNNKNKYLVQGTILAVSSIIVRFIGLLYRIPLTRIVGDTGMGYYTSAFEIYNLALILSSYSIPVAVSKLVSAREIKKEYRNAKRVFITAIYIAATVGALMSLIIYFGANTWASIVKAPSIAIPLKVLAPTIFVFAIMGVLRGLFQGKNTMLPTAISQVIEQIVNAIVSIFAAYWLMKEHNASPEISAYGAAGGTLGTFIGAITGLAFLLFIYSLYRPVLNKKIRKDNAKHQESYKEVAVAFAYTVFPIILSQTVYQLSGTLDNVIFGQIMSTKDYVTEEVVTMWGIYGNKYKMLTTVPVAIASAFGTSIVPALAASYARDDYEGLRHKTASSVKINMLLAIPSAVGLAVLAKPIILVIFRDSNLDLSVKLLQVGSIAVVFFALSTLTNGILQGIDQLKLPVRHAAISLGIHVVVLFVLLKVFDLTAYGLVFGNITFALVVCILNWISIGKHMNYKQEVVKTFLIPLMASVIMGVVAALSFNILYRLLPSNIVCLMISIMIAVAVYGILIILMKAVDEEELREMPFGRKIISLCKKIHLL